MEQRQKIPTPQEIFANQARECARDFDDFFSRTMQQMNDFFDRINAPKRSSND